MHSWAIDWRGYPKVQYIVPSGWCAGSKRALQAKMNRIPKERQRRLMALLPRCPSTTRTLTHTMSLPTVMQDEILYLSGVVPNWKKSRDIKNSYQAVATIDQENVAQLASFIAETYFTSETLMDAYNSSLIANRTDRDAIASPSCVKEGVSAWRSWLKDGADLVAVPAFHEAIDNLDTFREKQFCITKQGYLCLVPTVTQPTDVVAIIKGMDMPPCFDVLIPATAISEIAMCME